MKTIGIIGAMEEEVAIIKEKLEIITEREVIGLIFTMGRLFGNTIVIVRCGIGKVNAAVCTQVMIDHFAVDCIINVGVAGAIARELSLGDIVISKDAIQHDMDCSVFGDPIGTIPRMEESCFLADEELIFLAQKAAAEIVGGHQAVLGRIASGDQFISSAEAKTKIWTTVKASCAEMEGAAIAHACWLNRIPFVIIRSISDNADGKADLSFEEFTPVAAKNSSDLVEKMIALLSEKSV